MVVGMMMIRERKRKGILLLVRFGHKYLGVHTSTGLKFNTYIDSICFRVNRTPGFLIEREKKKTYTPVGQT